jgi:hypothetical protein
MSAAALLDEPTLSSIEVVINQLMNDGQPLVPELKRRFPGLMFVRCSTRDMAETPFRCHDRYRLYLLDRRDHCIRVTDEPAFAGGVIVAQHEA